MAYKKPEQPLRCLQCGDVLPYGRPDRKFCSCECKNKYNNLRRFPRPKETEVRVMAILRRNYVILRKLLIMGVTSIDRETLLQLGFDAQYGTSFRKQGHRDIFTCFDILYELTPSRVNKICFTGEGAGGKKGRLMPSGQLSADL